MHFISRGHVNKLLTCVCHTHTVAETWCQKILCHLCQWHCAGWSMAGCSRLCNPFPRHRRCRCASGQLSTTMTNWPISMRCLADDLIGLGIKLSASPINEDLTLASEVQISRYEMLGWIWVWRLNAWAPNGLVLTFNEAQRPRIYLPGFLTGKPRRLRKSRNNKCDSSLVHQWQIYI